MNIFSRGFSINFCPYGLSQNHGLPCKINCNRIYVKFTEFTFFFFFLVVMLAGKKKKELDEDSDQAVMREYGCRGFGLEAALRSRSLYSNIHLVCMK